MTNSVSVHPTLKDRHGLEASAFKPIYFWSGFGVGQKKWPIPGTSMLVVSFLAGCVVPATLGAPGLVAVFIAAAFFPSQRFRRFVRRGDLISALSISTCTMMVGNYDALGDVYGSTELRFSWILLILAGVVILFRLRLLKGRSVICSAMVGTLIGFNVASAAIGGTKMLRAIEINGSYLAAFLLILINLVRCDSRDALVYQLVLATTINCGFCLFEMLFPGSSASISSSKIGDETVRSAGIYANAITSGLMTANTLLLASICCTKESASAKERLSLMVFIGLCGIGVLVTFSRSAALALFMAGVIAVFRLSGNRFGRLIQYAPFAAALVLVSFFGTGEYLSGQGRLKRDATERYGMVKSVLSGDVARIFDAVRVRARAWQPSKRYWRNPRIAGNGFNFVAERDIYPPHNMIILTLVETGWIGLLLLVVVVLYLCGFGAWRLSGQNAVVFGSIFLPLVLILIESHALFTRRYFAIYLVMLTFASCILFQPGKKEN